MSSVEIAEKISITLPPEMLSSIKDKVQAGLYGSTSEVIREAMRLWQSQQEEQEARIALIRSRIERSADNEETMPMEDAFDGIRKMHKKLMDGASDEDL